MSEQTHPIDFVIMWVDGADPVWLEKKKQFQPDLNTDDAVNRYRDWGTLPYWFRAVEQFAPWVNHIWLVTDGQCPPWLNTAHEKLTLVDHRDFIPQAFLPSFNACSIELNLHRIAGLAEHFVFFNDDFFLLRPVPPERFFQNGLPCDDAVLSPIIMDGETEIGKICANDLHILNRHFDKEETMRRHRGKFLNLCYGTQLLRTICLLPWHHFPGFFNDHLPQPFLKSTFEEIWSLEDEALRRVCANRFRDYGSDVNQWLMRYWQFANGAFVPASPKRGRCFTDFCPEAAETIRTQACDLICINDSHEQHFEESKAQLLAAFESILPGKSAFEL